MPKIANQKILGEGILLVIAILASIAFTSTDKVSAQSPSPQNNQSNYCQRATKAISSILSGANSRLAKRQKYVNDRKSNIQSRINDLKSKGADVVRLQNDAQQFYGLLDQWYSDYQKYTYLIQQTQNYTCGVDDGRFNEAVQAARSQLEIINQDSIGFKSYYQNTLNNDFAVSRKTVKPPKVVPKVDPKSGVKK